jgi:hypothetical protein
MGGACCTCGEVKCLQGFGAETQKEKPTCNNYVACRWEDDIKIDLKKVVCMCVYWIYLTGDTEKWRTVVDTVMNIRVP